MPDPDRRYAFVIVAGEGPDALVRVLTLFAVQPLALASVTMAREDDGCAIHIEVDGLDAQRAETLSRRLAGLAAVRSVGLGWRGTADPPDPRAPGEAVRRQDLHRAAVA